MPSPTRSLAPADVRAYVEGTCLALSDQRRVGVEREWFIVRAGQPGAHVPFDDVRALIEAVELPRASRVTFEPGGQVELSSLPEHDPSAACESLQIDAAAVTRALSMHGYELLASGMDPVRPLHRVIDAPRYLAMEAYFDAGGAAGRRMMCGTAAIQVNLEAGTAADADRRWQRAHALGATLGAAFANSPLAGGMPTGWRSGRLATWWAIDPTRTAPAVSDRGIVHAWERYLMGARVMMIRTRPDAFEPILAPMTFAQWLHDGHELGFPTREDLEYHCTTLFPPVRLRGWLELRFLDALPDPWWHVAVAVVTALLDDEEAAELAERTCAPAADLWHQAARNGLDHPVLSLAAKECFAAAQEALERAHAPASTRDTVADYYDRFVARGRCPADDVLDAHERRITLEPAEVAWT